MKKLKYLIVLSLAIFVMGCEKETYEFGDLITPSEVVVTYELVGANAANPLGDGTGVVNFSVNAKNALAYKFVYKSAESNAPSKLKSYSFKSAAGPLGTFAVSKHTVAVIVYGTGGASSSKSIEVEVLAPNVPPPTVVQDFEGAAPSFRTFGPDGHPISIVGNPFKGGLNESNKVVQYAKPVDSQGWAGLAMPIQGLDFDIYSKISLLVYSPKSNIEMVLKVETDAGDTDPKYEKVGKIDRNGDWIEVTFDFSEAPQGDYTNVVLFFNTWNSGDGSTYYFDDIKLFN